MATLADVWLVIKTIIVIILAIGITTAIGMVLALVATTAFIIFIVVMIAAGITSYFKSK